MNSDPAKHLDPLPGRVGHVAGIESLVLDGQRYFFGFDGRSDMVVSPLIDDPDTMAAFASEHIRQIDGRHEPDYWADLVAWAVHGSDLVAKDADREFDTARLRAELPLPGSHVLYLLDAVAGWDESLSKPAEVERAYTRLGFDEEDQIEALDHALEVVRAHGAPARPDEWTVVRFHLGSAVRRVPGNWTLLFDPVGECVAAHG
ncbi:hypothetical protein ACFZBU_14120 [Embleya sp. NPDC008237]|uniref:hypothetical protein n=1 Tax=Embleya sp. NPDC008237 TaxID=3363978 RepID=UPI0036EFF296